MRTRLEEDRHTSRSFPVFRQPVHPSLIWIEHTGGTRGHARQPRAGVAFVQHAATARLCGVPGDGGQLASLLKASPAAHSPAREPQRSEQK